LTQTTSESTLQIADLNSFTRYYLRLGALIPVIFFATTIVCGFILGDYNHISRMVSELGASGTSSQYVFATGLLICSAMSVFFVVGLYKSCRTAGISTVPVIILLCYSVSIAGAALFPLPQRLHEIMGMPSIFMVLSPFLGLILWRKDGKLKHVGPMSLIGLFVMSLGFLAFVPDILEWGAGLKQRVFHIGWSVWFVYLSYAFAGLHRLRAVSGKEFAPK
jgi:hypothetical protein